MSTDLASRRVTLWDVESELANVMDQLAGHEAAGTEPGDELVAEVRGYLVRAEEKRDRLADFLAQTEAYEAYLDTRIEELKARKKSLANARTRLCSWVQGIMLALDAKKLTGTVSSFVLVPTPGRVIVDGPLAPEWERVIPETREPDKVKLRDALKAGVEVSGAHMEPGGWRLKVGIK